MASEKEIRAVLSIETRIKAAQGLGSLDKQFRHIADSVKNLKGLRDLDSLARSLDRSAKSAENLSKHLASALTSARALGVAGAGPAAGAAPPAAPGAPPPAGGGAGGAGGGAAAPAAGGQRGRLGPFARGFAQGAGGPAYQLGRGGLRQIGGFIAGRAVGGVVRAGFGGASAIATGAAGVQRGLGALPFGIGGIAAGQFSAAEGAADDALALRRQAQAVFQQDFANPIRDKAALAAAQAEGVRFVKRAGDQAAAAAEAEIRKERGKVRITRVLGGIREPFQGALSDADRARIDLARERAAERAGRRTREGAIVDTRIDQLFDDLRGYGEDRGYNVRESLGIAQRASAAGGGSLVDPNDLFGLNTAKAAIAASRLGISPEVIGKLGLGLRRNVVSGSFDLGTPETRRTDFTSQAANTMLINSFRLGIDKSEIADHMAKLVSEFEEARRGGYSMNINNIANPDFGFRALGLTPEAAAGAGAGLRAAGRRIGATGPQGLDFLMMGAFGSEGGLGAGPMTPDEMLRRRIALEQGTFMTPERILQFARQRIGAGGGGAAGVQLFGAELQRAGVNISATSLGGIFNDLQNGKSDADLIKSIRAATGGPEEEAIRRAGIGGMSEAITAPQVARDVQLYNERVLDAGNKFIDTFQNLADAQTTSLKTSTAVFSEALDKFSAVIKDAAHELSAAVDRMRQRSAD